MRFSYLASRLSVCAFAFGGFTACGGGDDAEPPKAGALGASCDPASASACASGLECTPRTSGGNVCSLAAGAKCDATNTKLHNAGCADSATCAKKDGETATTCLVAEGGDCDPESDHCDNALVCSELEDGKHRCFGEVVLRGEVEDAADKSPLEDARVMAVNEEGVAVTAVARTDAKGNYELPVPAVRHDDGTPVDTKYTLRAAAQDYQAFPSGARVALPIDVSTAMLAEKRYVVENTLTTIDLIGLPAGERSMISGSIVALDSAAPGAVGGVLVVAKGADAAVSGLSDKSGDFTIFNVPAGDYELKAYGADVQIESKSVSVGSSPLDGVELKQLDEATTTVSGSVQIVNAAGTSATSVILVVEDTFDANVARGEVPRGLRSPKSGAPNVTGGFMISGVPAGKYVVLAAYENDGLVRDPDTNIAGTDFVHLEVMPGQSDVTISDSFKVTAALGTVSPGAEAPEAVTGKPDLVWLDDSSEDWYDLHVFDALGNEVWKSLMLPAVKGSTNVTVKYGGPLDPGMYYQFRVSSWRQPGNGSAAPIATTEDLRGVFYLPAQ
jgi:hypothetical protein